MLLLQDAGVNIVRFHADNLRQGWDTRQSGNNPTLSLVLCLTNDMTRETQCVELMDVHSTSGADLIHYNGGKLTAAFLALSSGTSNGAHHKIKLEHRGYWSYVLYEHGVASQFPSNADLTSIAFLSTGLGVLYNEVDRGKALVVSPTQYTQITIGTTANNITEYNLPNGEVSYTEHTDKITSSDIDTENNFIHIK